MACFSHIFQLNSLSRPPLYKGHLALAPATQAAASEAHPGPRAHPASSPTLCAPLPPPSLSFACYLPASSRVPPLLPPPLGPSLKALSDTIISFLPRWLAWVPLLRLPTTYTLLGQGRFPSCLPNPGEDSGGGEGGASFSARAGSGNVLGSASHEQTLWTLWFDPLKICKAPLAVGSAGGRRAGLIWSSAPFA